MSHVFENKGDYYQVKHPIVSARFYTDHTEFFDENFAEVRINDERWVVEYFENDAWQEASPSNATLNDEIINENELLIIRTGETNVGVLKQTYNFTKGSPLKIDLELTTSRDVQARFNYTMGGEWSSSGGYVNYDDGRVSLTIYGKNLDTSTSDIYYTEKIVDIEVALR